MAPTSSKPSILDVAKAAAVSPSTVSLVLNNRKGVSEATRKRVDKAMRDLGYRARSAGRPVRQVRRTQIAVIYLPRMIVSGAVASICHDWIAGVRSTEDVHGLRVNVFAGGADLDADLLLRKSIEEGEIKGAILLGGGDGKAVATHLDFLQQHRVPVVTMMHPPRHCEHSSVIHDTYSGVREAVDHVANLGHRHIAPIFSSNGSYSMNVFRQGVYDGIMHRQLTSYDGWAGHAQTDFDDKAAYERMCDDLLKAKVTAVISGDYVAIRLVERLTQMGLSIPRDMTIIGHDAIDMHPSTGHKITSVGCDRLRMGSVASSILRRLIRKPSMYRHMVVSVPSHLVPGDTDAPPRL